MQILLLGNSLAAMSVCRVLACHHDVRIISNDKVIATHIEKSIDCQLIFDNPLAKTAWEQAKIAECDVVIALHRNEEKNIIASQIIAKYYHIPLCITNVGSQYYPHKEVLFTDNATKHIVLSIEHLLSTKVEHMLRHHHCQEVISTAKNQIYNMSITLTNASPMINQPLSYLIKKLHHHQTLVALYRDNKLHTQKTDLIVKEGDAILIAQQETQARSNLAEIIGNSTPYQRIIIAGVSQISINLLASIQNDYNITLIEPDLDKAQRAASLLQNIVVVNGSINDDDLLVQEGIKDCDAFIALSTDDENNLACALQACNYQVGYVSTLITQEGLIPVVEHTPIHSIISTQGVLTDHINKHTQPINVIAMHHLAHHQGIIIELQIPKHMEQSTINDWNLPSDCIAYGIFTNNKLIMHTKDYVAKVGDSVHVFCPSDQYAADIITAFSKG